MTPRQLFEKNREVIHQQAPDFSPKLGIILGSGVGSFVNEIQRPISIPYEQLPAMRPCHVEGHSGVLYLGTLKGLSVACFQGRNHLYEGHSQEVIQAPIRTLKLLGVDTVILVSMVGSMSTDFTAGSLALVSDHINLQARNPLVGMNDEFWGPRFPNMEHAYDPALRAKIQQVALELNIPLKEAIYMGVLGPSYETPAEISAFARLGASIVGMSTVSEVILARHCGIKVLAISVVSNMAAGMSQELVDHRLALEVTAKAVHDLSRLLLTFIEQTFVFKGESHV